MTELGVSGGPRTEIRADATNQLIAALTTAASGAAVKTWAAGAVECAAGMWSRALATATVDPDGIVDAAWLAQTGRDLARHGEVAYLLDVASQGRMRLLRATVTDVHGDSPDPAEWFYRLTLQSPRTTRTVTAPAASVVHVRYATEAHSPARALAPLEYASYTGKLTASLEQSLGYEAGGAVANLIALPEGFNAQPPAGDDEDETGRPVLPADTLAESIRTARGRTLMPETTASSYGDTGARPPRRDFEPVRLGANPPQAMVQLRQQVECSVLGCFGVPAPLGPMGVNDGTAQRESLRRFWTLTVQPPAALIAGELTRVLERPVRLSYARPSGAADVAARARAVAALAKSGVSTEDAMVLTGWNDGA